MDNAATSFPKPATVLDAMVHFATGCGASAGRGGYAEAVECGRLLSEVRQRLCSLFNGADPRNFIFTLNCTDGLNLAIKGLVDPAGKGHAICSCIDHNSILRPLGTMEDRGWLAVTRVRVDPRDGLVDPAEIDMLEDLLVAAFNDARGKSEALMQSEMQKLTAGLNLPAGLKLPF